MMDSKSWSQDGRRREQPPTVLHPVLLPDFIEYLLRHHAEPSTLIVCSARDDFIHHLLGALPENTLFELYAGNVEEIAPVTKRSHLLVPTINLLAASRTLKVVFCSSLPALQAYLSVYTVMKKSGSKYSGTGTPTLGLLNPIALHEETSSYSAQGLGRTFASAVEAASRAAQQLLIAECCANFRRDRNEEELGEETDYVMAGANTQAQIATNDPWQQQLAILNVTTRTFGASERGWVGRTVKAKMVAERWCRFEALDDGKAKVQGLI
ncbi:hypothetical protein M501DRAFT_1058219 [Patellaria atrata CBS 101060]|uniref:Uncharacterized protein n=1 Tax=Patellaria atrata CBS 101060 TaxID=1346257 RepID=A0A9P4SAD9_9PEZI|nr:hypothetical protein M501DRAFT_1058219 [Patellaria atrata CBS 101060]